MKKFKPNVMATAIFAIFEIGLPCIAGVIILFSLLLTTGELDPEAFKWMFIAIGIFGPIEFLLIFNVFTLVTLPFQEYYVFLYDEYFVHNNITVNYRDVSRIEIDSGELSRYSRGTPCSLNFFIDGELITSIKKPPFTLTFILLKRCRYADKKYIKLKSAIITSAIIIAVFLGIAIYALSQI